MSHTKVGKVISIKNKNTINVLIEDRLRHPVYGKVVARSTKIKAHIVEEGIALGDVVTIRSCRPMSKTKHFEFVKKVENK